MNIQIIPIEKINPAAYNPRKDLKPGDPEYEKLKKSLAEFDLVEPLIWNKRSSNLIGGHQRLKILQERGDKQVEVSVVDLPPSKEKALNLALNKISGEWDMPRLKDLLEEINTGEFDIEITGFDDKEIEDLMTQFHLPEEGLTPDDEIPEQVETVCKKGDLWKLGSHRLLVGDATKKEDVERLMGGEKTILVFTDPPYGIDLDTDWTGVKGSKKSPGWIQEHFSGGGKYPKVIGDNKPFQFSDFAWVDCKEQFWCGADYYHRGLPDDGSWFVWDKRLEENADLMIGNCFELIWSRNKHRKEFIRRKWAGVFGLAGEDSIRRIHPTQKPVDLSIFFINKFSQESDIILDLFGGSGSTLIACEKLRRRCYMMEISEMYCSVIKARWENFTGRKAELVK